MIQENALVPKIIISRGNNVLDNAFSIVIGVVMLSLLAQIAITLPWTPVPITGQTFGVAFTALLWGRKRGFAAVLAYLVIGALGMPVFALGKSGLMMGPTMGYLIGMGIAAYWMGLLSDLGWTKTFGLTWIAAISGSVITFSFGMMVLSAFIPSDSLVVAGVLPFLPGDAMKCFLAAVAVTKAQQITIKKDQ